MGSVMTFASVAVASWRISRLNVVRAIRDLPEPAGHYSRLFLLSGALLAVAGVAGAVLGLGWGGGLGNLAGAPAPAIGLAFVASSRFPARVPMTLAGVADLTWHLGPRHLLDVDPPHAPLPVCV